MYERETYTEMEKETDRKSCYFLLGWFGTYFVTQATLKLMAFLFELPWDWKTVVPPYLTSLGLVAGLTFIHWLKCFSCVDRSSSRDLLYSIENLDVVRLPNISMLESRSSKQNRWGYLHKNECPACMLWLSWPYVSDYDKGLVQSGFSFICLPCWLLYCHLIPAPCKKKNSLLMSLIKWWHGSGCNAALGLHHIQPFRLDSSPFIIRNPLKILFLSKVSYVYNMKWIPRDYSSACIIEILETSLMFSQSCKHTVTHTHDNMKIWVGSLMNMFITYNIFINKGKCANSPIFIY